MIVIPLLWQVPKTFHQKFLFPALGYYHVDLDFSVSTCCALKHFFRLNPVPNVYSTTPVDSSRLDIASIDKKSEA